MVGRWQVHGRVVTPGGVVPDGVVVGDGQRIVWVGPRADRPADLADASPLGPVAASPLTVLPGLVDLHCHGGGGESFPDATTLAAARAAAHEHLQHGTTSLVASLVTADAATLLARTAVLADLADAGDVVGIHLEGPFLSEVRCGAQDPGLMVPGDAALVRDVARVARGHLTTMTIAPEVPGVLGADGALAALAEVGALPSIGHTDAAAELVDEAVRLATTSLAASPRSHRATATHLFNGMAPLHHRQPGPVAALLAAAARGELVVELVADGVHLAPGVVRMVFDLVGPDATVLVTDAMAAAGMPDGEYQLGPARVRVVDGVARLAEGGAIAGGTAHLLDVVRATVAAGVPLADAVRAASLTPAAVLGRPDIGALEPGRRADLALVDDELRPVQVIRAGLLVA